MNSHACKIGLVVSFHYVVFLYFLCLLIRASLWLGDWERLEVVWMLSFVWCGCFLSSLFYFFFTNDNAIGTNQTKERERERVILGRGERPSRVVCRPSCCFESWLEFLLVLVLLLLWYERTNLAVEEIPYYYY